MTQSPKVYLLILNWNAPHDTVECIDSCYAQDYANQHLVVIDNHSADDSVAILRKRFPNIHMIQNDENLGYAEGNNVGMRYVLKEGADLILILNNDVILEPNVVSRLVKAAVEDPTIGMLAPKVNYYDTRDIVNSLGTNMNWLKMRPNLGECLQKDVGQFTSPLSKDILVGCALMVRASIVNEIGMFDKKFFIFHEEADWCFRHLKHGYKNVVIPEVVAYHKASKTMSKFSALTHYYSVRNFLYLAQKNANLRDVCLTYLGVSYLSLKHVGLYLKNSAEHKNMVRAFFLGIRDYFGGKMNKCTYDFSGNT